MSQLLGFARSPPNTNSSYIKHRCEPYFCYDTELGHQLILKAVYDTALLFLLKMRCEPNSSCENVLGHRITLKAVYDTALYFFFLK